MIIISVINLVREETHKACFCGHGCPGIRSARRKGGQDLEAVCGESLGSRGCSLMKGVGIPRGRDTV